MMQEKNATYVMHLKASKELYIFWRQSNNVYEKYIDTEQTAESLDFDGNSPSRGTTKKGGRSVNLEFHLQSKINSKFNFLFSKLAIAISSSKESLKMLKEYNGVSVLQMASIAQRILVNRRYWLIVEIAWWSK